MLLTYYVEVNLTAIIIASILIFQTTRKTSRGESSNIVFYTSLWLLIAMCAGDIAALVSDGRSYPGAHFVVVAGNSIFLGAQAMLAFIWLVFFQIRLKLIRTVVSRRTIIISIPLVVFLVSILTNGFTKFLFTVDANNIYRRADYICIHWIVEAIYVIGAFVQLIVAIYKANSKLQRREYISYFLYFIPTLAAGGWQIINFGASTFQLGVAISSLLVFLQIQDGQMIRDELTGLNNRRSLRNYEAALVNTGEEVKLTLFMIDVDSFKHINDTYGHVTGDEALVQIAKVLKKSLGKLPGNRVVIYRYAGDEFVLAGTDMNLDIINLAKKRIQEELDLVNASNVNPYKLSLSIGVATGRCRSTVDFDEILQKADDSMYQVKTRKKRKTKQTR